MKKILTIVTIGLFALQSSFCIAQRPHRGDHHGLGAGKHPEITEIISDLTSAQKSKLEAISNESKKRIEDLRNQQKSVCYKISQLMDMEGDHSKELNPLFDREARLQAEISREMYSTKVRFDQVLTKDQRKELKDSRKKHKMRKK